jgi:hypothetical protein
MDSYAQAREKDQTNAEIIGQKRQEKALREFKQVLEDLVFLLRTASSMETVYMYWVNRSREQFVMETKSTTLPNVMFQDRVAFEEHFLDAYKDITEPITIEVQRDLDEEALSHYYNEVPVQYVTILPFINNGETVAITVLESTEHLFTEDKSEIVYAYINALRNILNTYLEISDLYQKQEEWIEYERSLEVLETKGFRTELLSRMLDGMQGFLNKGGVSLVARSAGVWCNVLNSGHAEFTPPVGMPLEDKTIAYDALQKGKPDFAIHFNNNPKRLSPRELHTKGATLAIPVMISEHRQGVVLAYDENPLIFKESTKHKLINFVRITGLKIKANVPKLDLERNLLVNEYGAFLPDLMELSIETELQRVKQGITSYTSWLGLITLSDLPSIRTKLRLDELNQMQKDLIAAFNPSRFGISGMIGFYSDYVYSFIIQSKDRRAVEHWTTALKKEFGKPFELTNGRQISSGIKVGFTSLDDQTEDFYQAISNAKTALSKAVKSGHEHSQQEQD